MEYHDARPEEMPASPFINEFVMVLCAGFQYMAYLDQAGRWRDAYNQRELRPPVKILW